MDEVLLAIQVGRFDHIKIDQDKSSYPDPCQCDRNHRSEAAQSCDPYRSLFFLFMDPGSMSCHHQGFEFLLRRGFPFLDKDKFITLAEGAIRGKRKSVVN